MLIIDQLKRSDQPLRVLALGILGGMGVLLLGLWYLQVVSSHRYVETLMIQSFRTVRIPAIRGKILDRNDQALAECRPSYNITLYLDELSKQYQQEFQRLRPKEKVSRPVLDAVARQARYHVVSNAVQQLSQTLRQPLWLNADRFHKHYDQRLALPLTILENLSPTQIALFQEQPQRPPGFDLEVQPLRFYPHGTTAAHLLGYLRREEAVVADEDGLFNYRLPDFRGVIGVEAVFDADLRGKAGVKSVLVNYLGYRQSEQIWSPAEAGQNLVLTIDARVQEATEAALHTAGARLRGAAVVLDPNNGDLLALASSPAYNPNDFIPRIGYQQWEQLNDPEWNPTLNRATYGSYAPGSIFKIIVALAALNANVLDPNETFMSPGFYQLGREQKGDTAPAGPYQFQRAFLVPVQPHE